jgi:hypothetical protein
MGPGNQFPPLRESTASPSQAENSPITALT